MKEKICSIYNLNRAFLKRKSCRMWKPSVMDYYLHMTRYNYILHKQLMAGSYRVKPCYHFNICDPKPRSIEAPHLTDGIIQSSVNTNYLNDKLRPVLLPENCACQIGKGTDYARELFKSQLREYYRRHGIEGYALKVDLKSFFASIDGDSLHELNLRYIQDPWVISMVESWGVKPGEKGLGLGAETNQTESCLALHPIDTYCKTVLSCRYYVRYQDDIIMILPSKAEVARVKAGLITELGKYKLKLNEKKTQLYRLNDWIPFPGFRFTVLPDTGKVLMKVRREGARREKRKLKHQAKLEIPSDEIWQSFTCWYSYASKGYNYYILKRMEDFIMEVLHVDRKEEMQREIALAKVAKLEATLEYLALMSDVDLSDTTTEEVTA